MNRFYLLSTFRFLFSVTCLSSTAGFCFAEDGLLHNFTPLEYTSLINPETRKDSDTLSQLVFSVEIRTIKAFNHVTEEQAIGERHIDSSLRDLSYKLLKLPYRNFRQISSRTIESKIKEKENILLPDNMSIVFKPLSLENDRVSFWIKWIDFDGETLLDSKMRFNLGESVLTGTDNDDDDGVVLAIKVDKKP